VFATAKQMFQYAVAQEYLTGNPIVLVDRSVLPKKEDKDPSWRSGAVFSKDEVEQLISDARVAPHRRVAYAIEFLTGLRTGQVSALRWGDWQREVIPLAKLTSAQSYDSHAGKEKTTKTRVVHEVPVHPTLAAVLAAWKLTGWRERHGHAPKPGDLMIPTIHGGHRDVRKALEDFNEDLRRLGLRKRRHYDARRTFTSLALSGRASKDVLKHLTHPRPADAFDLYVTPTWEALCEAVQCIPVAVRRGEVVELRSAEDAPGFGANEALEERAG
jgi:integrase